MHTSVTPKPKLNARIVRAFVVGLAVAIAVGFAVFILATGLETQILLSSASAQAMNQTHAAQIIAAKAVVFNPVVFALLAVGFVLASALGIELSRDLAGD